MEYTDETTEQYMKRVEAILNRPSPCEEIKARMAAIEAKQDAEVVKYYAKQYPGEPAKAKFMKEVHDVAKLPSDKRNDHYLKVKKERGVGAAEALVAEVKKQRYWQKQREGMEM